MYRTHYYYFSHLRIRVIDNYVLWHLFNVFSARCLPFSYHFYIRRPKKFMNRNFSNFTDKSLVSIDAYVLYINFDNFLYFLFCEIERCGRRMSNRRCHGFDLISVNEQQLNMHRKTITRTLKCVIDKSIELVRMLMRRVIWYSINNSGDVSSSIEFRG